MGSLLHEEKKLYEEHGRVFYSSRGLVWAAKKACLGGLRAYLDGPGAMLGGMRGLPASQGGLRGLSGRLEGLSGRPRWPAWAAWADWRQSGARLGPVCSGY